MFACRMAVWASFNFHNIGRAGWVLHNPPARFFISLMLLLVSSVVLVPPGAFLFPSVAPFLMMDFFIRLVYSLDMKRILILGSCGAGKSTLAKRLHDILGIDIIHLDQHYWKPSWTRTESEEWQKKVEDLIKEESWIMDGNYRSTMDLRLPQADAIIWLDFSPPVCFYRIVKRRLKNNRVDALAGCKERISFELLKWVLWKFPRENRPDIAKRLEILKGKKDIHILKSNKDAELFLANLSSKYESAKN